MNPKKIPHSKPPQVCQQCLEIILADTDRAPDADHVAYCPENLTFITARVRAGTLCQWDLIAPMLPSDAAEMKKNMSEHARLNGIPVLRPGLN